LLNLTHTIGSKNELIESIGKLVAADKTHNIMAHAVAHRVLRRCIALKPAKSDSNDIALATSVLNTLKSEGTLKEWALHPQGGFVILSLLEHETTGKEVLLP